MGKTSRLLTPAATGLPLVLPAPAPQSPPVTDLYAVNGGLKQKFQRGWLIYNQHEGKVYVQYGRTS